MSQNKTPGSRTGLRNRSGNASGTTSSVMKTTASMSSITETNVAVQPIDEEIFKKADTDKKLDMIASAFNKISETFNNKIDNLRTEVDTKLNNLETLEKKIDKKLDPLWDAVFEEEVGLKDVVRKLETDFYTEDTGIKSKVQELEKAADFTDNNYRELAKQLDVIKFEQEILRGYATKHEDQLFAVQDKVIDMTAKSMENNISISGLEELPEEDPITILKKFLMEELRIADLDTGELYKIKEAFRIGVAQPNKPRNMIVKCNQFLRKKILEAAKEYNERQG